VYLASVALGSNPISTFIIPALLLIILVIIRVFSLCIMDITCKEVPMNKYISSTLCSISCLLETVWAGLTGVVFGQAIGFVTHVVTLAKYINHALFTITPHNAHR